MVRRSAAGGNLRISGDHRPRRPKSLRKTPPSPGSFKGCDVALDVQAPLSPRIHPSMLKPTVQVHNENGILVAEFWDCLRLDPGAVQELRKKYEAHLRSGGRPELVVDLLGVGFAGSASLGHFVALHRVARSKNGRLVFCNVDPTVFEVFRVSKLDPLFRFVTDRATALVNAANPEPGPSDGAASPDGSDAGKNGGEAPRKPSGGSLLRSRERRKLS
jgi:anti-anti-sigma factor